MSRSPARLAVHCLALLVLVPAVAGGLAGCGAGQPAAPDRLVIAAGAPDEVYGLLGEALAVAARREWSAQVEVVPTEGSVSNLRLVAEGRADVGFATVEAATLAQVGNRPFSTALPIQALGHLYDDYLQVITLADGPVESLADLAGRAVSIGADGSGTDLAAARVLFAAGLEPADQREWGAAASAEALAGGEIDAFFVAGGLPTPVVSSLAEEVDLRLLSLPPEVIGGLQDEHGEYYLARSIPAGTYRLDSEVETVSVPNVLVVRADLPEPTGYRLTELLFGAKPELVAAHEEARRLSHRSALATFPIELHAGARAYYRDEKPLATGGG